MGDNEEQDRAIEVIILDTERLWNVDGLFLTDDSFLALPLSCF